MQLKLTHEQIERVKAKQKAVNIAQSELYKECRQVEKEAIETGLSNMQFPTKVDVMMNDNKTVCKAYIVGVRWYSSQSEPFVVVQVRKCKTDGSISAHRLMDVKEIVTIEL